MDLIITILPVVAKDLLISPRFRRYGFYRDASSAILQQFGIKDMLDGHAGVEDFLGGIVWEVTRMV